MQDEKAPAPKAGLPPQARLEIADIRSRALLETREEAAAVLALIKAHAPFGGEFTRGLYFKGTS